MDVDGVLHGDPLEASALEGIRWDWNATSHTASPRSTESVAAAAAAADDDDDKEKSDNKSKDTAKGEGGADDGVAVTVWRRYAFSSQLQRMSVVAEVSGSAAALTAKGKGKGATAVAEVRRVCAAFCLRLERKAKRC